MTPQEIIEQQSAAIIELTRLAYTDALTGAFNRLAFEKWAEDVTEPHFVTLIDLDNFKALNDSKGHEAGDKMLCTVTQFLKSLPNVAEVFRLGGDEFVIVHSGYAMDIIKAIKGFRRGDVTLSVGMGWLNTGSDISTVLRRADANMYEDKKAKGQRSDDRRARPNR